MATLASTPMPDCGGYEKNSTIHVSFYPLVLLPALLCVSYSFPFRSLLTESNNANRLEAFPRSGCLTALQCFSGSSKASHSDVYTFEASNRRPANGRNAAVSHQCP
ncbi:hypothetical protein FSOLCH5_013330 [Fusarium solani]